MTLSTTIVIAQLEGVYGYAYKGNGADSKGPPERKEKSAGCLSSAIGPWGLGANLSVAKNKNHQITKS